MPGALSRPAYPAASPSLFARRAWLSRALALCAATGVSGWPLPACATSLIVGQPAPPLVLHTLDGQNIATRALLGNVVILTFWASWCDPCREELPILSAYAARHAKEGLQVLGFSFVHR